MAQERMTGHHPATYALEGHRSKQLSYIRNMWARRDSNTEDMIMSRAL